MTADQQLDRVEQARQAALAGRAVAHEDLDRGGQHRIAGEDRLTLAEHHPRGRPVPSFDVAIHDVVVQQREVVHELDRNRCRHAVSGRTAARLGRQHRQG